MAVFYHTREVIIISLNVFELYAADYDQWFVDNTTTYLQELNLIRRITGTIIHPSLEIGVGSARFAIPLNISVGLEPSSALSKITKKRGLEVYRGVGEYLPFQSAVFCSVIMVTVLCFLDDPIQTCSEIYRVLSPGGSLYLAFLEKDGLIERKYSRNIEKGRFLSVARFYTRDDVAGIAIGAGFHPGNIRCKNGFCIQILNKI